MYLVAYMPNNYFKFKQFTIQQDKCAMKVCTDACLFGALVADIDLPNAKILDIGTGTGLLSLMIAQKNQGAHIDAVEINTMSVEQAAENVAASPWAKNIQVFNSDIVSFVPENKYDLIISNPPFFENDLLSGDEAKNNAKHDSSLNLLQLLNIVNEHLDENGILAVLLPYHRVNYFIEEAAKKKLYPKSQVLVKQTPAHTFFRGILFFSGKLTDPQLKEMFIKDSNQNYSPEFTAALKDYYLYL